MPRTEEMLLDGWEFSLEARDGDDFRSVRIPHDWAADAPFNKDMAYGGEQGYRDHRGVGLYRRRLLLDEKRAKCVYYLDFDGVYEDCAVRVNGREAGGQKYGYSPFRLNITEFVRAGENLIEVRVNNTALPTDRWYSGAGIYRAVKLAVAEEHHFDEREVVVQSKIIGARAVVSIKTGIAGKVTAAISDGVKSWEESGEGVIEINIQGVKLWSAEEPNLYTLTLSCHADGRVADSISMRLGIREIQFIPKKGMFVNGNPVKLKGVCLHQDIGCRGTAAKKEVWHRRLSLLKEMGCNCIRPSHHLFSEEFLDLCDEMGFYVYAEAFDKWMSGSYARYFGDNWQSDIAAMVKRDRNRPSVIIWGTGNEVENQGQESQLNLLKTLACYIKSLDNTRPVTYAMTPHFKYESGIDASKVADIQQFVDNADDYSITDLDEKVRRIKKIADIVDIISCNYSEQWYEDIYRQCPDKLILGTEVYQFFKGHREQLQNFSNENPNLVPFDNDYVIGGIVWAGFDYLGESMGWPAKGWSGALIRTNNEKKFGYYLMQSYWSDEPTVRLGVMDYSLPDEGVKHHWDTPMLAEHWHFPQFNKTVIPYMIATNCDEVGLYLNGKRFYLPKPKDCPNRIITGFLPYLPGTLRVVGIKDGNEVCEHVLVTPSSTVKLVFDKPEKCPAEKGYETLLTVRAADCDGNPCFRESPRVNFRAEGAAEIIAVDNGCITGDEPYGGTSIHMYRGVASVLIRLTGEPGNVMVHADAAGMISGTVAL